jgi:hypothetical protein
MIKTFWRDFKQGFKQFFWIGIALGIGTSLGSWSHPYEQCKRMYDTPEDISECVWIKENP